MKLEQLTKSLAMLRDEHEMDWTDVFVLGEILQRMEKGEVTIMEIVELPKVASGSTIHTRIKKLCDKQLLTKSEHTTNQRFKLLSKGPKLDRLLNKLEKI